MTHPLSSSPPPTPTPAQVNQTNEEFTRYLKEGLMALPNNLPAVEQMCFELIARTISTAVVRRDIDLNVRMDLVTQALNAYRSLVNVTAIGGFVQANNNAGSWPVHYKDALTFIPHAVPATIGKVEKMLNILELLSTKASHFDLTPRSYKS